MSTAQAIAATWPAAPEQEIRIFSAPVSAIATQRPPSITAFDLWPPLEIMRELWQEDARGAMALQAMQLAQPPKTAVLGRINDRASGVAFAAIHEKTAVIHALRVTEPQRRRGSAVNIMRHAAFWAQDHGADTLIVPVAATDTGLAHLCASLGMLDVEH